MSPHARLNSREQKRLRQIDRLENAIVGGAIVLLAAALAVVTVANQVPVWPR